MGAGVVTFCSQSVFERGQPVTVGTGVLPDLHPHIFIESAILIQKKCGLDLIDTASWKNFHYDRTSNDSGRTRLRWVE